MRRTVFKASCAHNTKRERDGEAGRILDFDVSKARLLIHLSLSCSCVASIARLGSNDLINNASTLRQRLIRISAPRTSTCALLLLCVILSGSSRFALIFAALGVSLSLFWLQRLFSLSPSLSLVLSCSRMNLTHIYIHIYDCTSKRRRFSFFFRFALFDCLCLAR